MPLLCVDPRNEPRWRQLIQQQPSTVFHSPRWLHVLADSYDFQPQAYLLVDEAGAPQAGLPYCRIKDSRGERLVTLPFSDYCDPICAQAADWGLLADQIIAQNLPATIRCLHDALPLTDQRFMLYNQAHWHGLDLQPDLATIWSNLPSAAKRAIKKAEQAGVVVHIATEKRELRAFFELHLNTRKFKYRMLAQPYLFFENIWRHFIEKDHGMLLVAVHQGQIIGATLFLAWQHTLYYKFNTSAPDHLLFRPNDLILWRSIEYAKQNGFTELDFGLSDWDQTGLIRYKAKFATHEKTISFLRHTPVTGAHPQNPEWQALLPQLTALLTESTVPNAVTEAAGQLLYRFFA